MSGLSVAETESAKIEDPNKVLNREASPPMPPSSSSVLSDAPARASPDSDTHLGTSQRDNSDVRPLDVAIDVNGAGAAATSMATGSEAATGQHVSDLATPKQTTPLAQRGSATRGRPRKRANLATNGTPRGDDITAIKMENGASQSTPESAARGRPRGRGGRPRGKGRAAGRGSKRKRDDDDDGDGDSDSSEEITPVATMTKSGRSIQKPTSFAPPPPSPAVIKKKRFYHRRNPESAVCKVCLRGNSPASNMIVFCDGCNAPYHRWCHHPPIDPAVVDEVDKEWFCKQCESERVVPVPEAEVANFISGEGASSEQRQKYFSSLPPGLLVTLLTKATTLQPALPLFDPTFKAKTHDALTTVPAPPTASTNGHPRLSASSAPDALAAPVHNPDPDEKYAPEVHPPHYVRPGQGLMKTLPPETEDLQWLVEDDDKHGVFTHVYRADPAAADAAVHGRDEENRD